MSESKTIRVVAVDDHEVVRSGLRFSLLAFDDIELVGEARDGEEALRVCSELKPDVVLMDLKMPGMNGDQATEALRQAQPEAKVIALTGFQERTQVQAALEAGAIGYLLKNVSADELACAIRAAHAGQATLSPEAVKALAEAGTGPEDFRQDLTKREREVLALLVEGMSNAEIARTLNISHHTARFHVSTILSKLNAANRAEAAALAIKHNLLS